MHSTILQAFAILFDPTKRRCPNRWPSIRLFEWISTITLTRSASIGDCKPLHKSEVLSSSDLFGHQRPLLILTNHIKLQEITSILINVLVL